MSFRTIFKVALISVIALIVFTAIPALYFFFTYYHALENEVVARFAQQHWNIPSRIYSDSTVIYPGQALKDLGFFERLARLNYHPVESGQVTERGEYSYDRKKGKLVIFLHNFSYPYREFPGEIVELDVSRNEVIQAMSEPDTHKPVYSIEIEPELNKSGAVRAEAVQADMPAVAAPTPASVSTTSSEAMAHVSPLQKISYIAGDSYDAPVQSELSKEFSWKKVFVPVAASAAHL